MTDLTDEAVKAMLNLLRSETEAASRTEAADMIEALHAELAQARADAKAAVAVVVEKAALIASSETEHPGFPYDDWGNQRSDTSERHAELVARHVLWNTATEIRALAPEDAIAEVAKLRAERDRINQWRETAIEERDTYSAERDTAEAELAAANAREARLRDFVDDFAKAKIDALRYQPAYGESPEDEPDPVVDAETVWAWQTDAKDALAALEPVAQPEPGPSSPYAGLSGIWSSSIYADHSAPDLTDQTAVHLNMLRGTIAKPTVDQIIHLYGVDALCKALVPVIVREAEAAIIRKGGTL